VEAAGKECCISIRDMGVGIPPELLPHIFERFYRVPGIETQTGSGIGLGLGLYISHKIVECHGGRIDVQSTPGDGSTFTIVLPLSLQRITSDGGSTTTASHT
jgi:two-component system, sensor histidine kinase and response regulator